MSSSVCAFKVNHSSVLAVSNKILVRVNFCQTVIGLIEGLIAENSYNGQNLNCQLRNNAFQVFNDG